MADLTYTNIEEVARHELDISRDEYALCNYIQTWSAYPNNRRPGYCDRTKGQMAEFIGISDRGIMKMLDRMEAKDLVERHSPTLFLHRITEKWFNTVLTAKRKRKGEQSSSFDQDGEENKVPPLGEQSSPFWENKVPPHKELSKRSSKSGGAHGKNQEDKGSKQPDGDDKKALLPQRGETIDDLEKPILEWAFGPGRESVKKWYADAMRKVTVGDVKEMITKFCSVYATIGDEGKRQRMLTHPLEFFKLSFKGFIKSQDSFEAKAQEKQGQKNGNNQEAVYEEPKIPVYRAKTLS